MECFRSGDGDRGAIASIPASGEYAPGPMLSVLIAYSGNLLRFFFAVPPLCVLFKTDDLRDYFDAVSSNRVFFAVKVRG